jgi:Fe-S oxidoreductase
MEKQIAFAVVTLLAAAIFLINISKFVRIAMLGKPANRPEGWGQRINSLVQYFFGQRKVAEEKSSWHHLLIYWGFLVIGYATTDMLLSGLFAEHFNFRVLFGETIHRFASIGVDYAQAIVAIVLGYAFFRRIVLKPRFIPVNLDAMLILGGILMLCLTHFGHHVFGMAAAGLTEAGSPVSVRLGELLGIFTVGTGGTLESHVDVQTAHVTAEAHWWAHMIILLSFGNYLPFSKHIHVLGSGPNILLRKQDQPGVMPKVQLFDGDADDPDAEPLFENWGVGRIEDFDWKSLIDNYSCTECARCTTYCPAFATDKPLSPMHLIHDLKDEMKERGTKLVELKKCGGKLPKAIPDEEEEALPEGADKDKIAEITKSLEEMPPLVGGRIKDETLWACTTCGACQEVCPVFIDHPLKILQMRSHIVLNDETGRTPGDVTRVIQNITSGQGNPWNANASTRMDWSAGLDVPRLADNPDAEYLFFVGCAGAYDDAAKKTTRALVKILNAAGVDFAVLGDDEMCTGDTVRRLGAEMDFQMMAQAQVDALNEAKVTKVIAQCPHCFHVIKNEYPQFGGKFEVIHHSKLIAHLLDSGKLKVDEPLAKKVTYHDSCYLGRWNDVYDAPRDAIRGAIEGAGSYVELERNGRHGFCCGAGGGRMWVEEEPEKRVNVNRTKEIVDAGVEAVAVGCPFCKTMLSDGMKHLDKEEDIEVLDIAQLVARTLPDPAELETKRAEDD